MISRYTRKEMGAIWSDRFKYDTWLRIEVLVCEKLCEMGLIPRKDFREIEKKASYNFTEIEKFEGDVKHDVIAFLSSVSSAVGEPARYIHSGLTSSDILDTALAYQLKSACDLIIKGAGELASELSEKAIRYRNTPVMGRTHGIHAEPTTFGLKMLVFHNEMKRNIRRLEFAREEIATGKISGAVGNFAHIDPAVEAHVCQSLGLKPAPASSQVVQRDRHATVFTAIAILGGGLEKIAIEIRHLQRTEVAEVAEGFSAGQKGSSAMPHKKNPIGSENITGISRLLRANALASLENIALWHERDISHSCVERVIAPDSMILVDYALHRMTEIIRNLDVFPEKMKENISLSKGLCFSGRVLVELAKVGLSREKAYRIVQRNSMQSLQERTPLQEKLMRDSELISLVGEGKLKKILENSFDLEYYFKNLSVIYGRSLT